MICRKLIAASSAHYDVLALRAPSPRLTGLFSSGAAWMYDRLQELHPADLRTFNPEIRYTGYGLMKYGICLTGALLCLAGMIAFEPMVAYGRMAGYGLVAFPASIAVFYLLEIHFLFLFPLLIDGELRPLRASLQATYKIGVGQCLAVVVPLAAFMMIGLLRRKDRLRNWYIGCLAILIWYNHEIRNRI